MSIKKTYSFSDELVQKIEILKEEKSFSTLSATVQYCIAETYERQMRNEKRMKKTGGIEDKLDIDERRAKREEEVCRDIASRLGGVINSTQEGYQVEYYTYAKTGKYLQKQPLLALKESMVEKQYFPSKGIVEKAWAKQGKKLK